MNGNSVDQKAFDNLAGNNGMLQAQIAILRAQLEEAQNYIAELESEKEESKEQ